MSDQILSQDEISALLGSESGAKKKKEAKASGESGEEKAADTAKAEDILASVDAQTDGSESGPKRSLSVSRNVFPILKPQGLGTELENTLNVVLDSFAQNGISTMAAALRAQVNLKVEGMDQLSYREFIQGLPEPSSIWSLRLNPMGLNVALCLESRLVHAMVDLLMGGNGSVPKIKRSITELDQSVMEGIVTVFCQEFRQAWARVMAFDMEIESRETRPGFLQLYSHGENMISIIMLMRAGETEGQVFWGIPGLMLLKFKNKMEMQSYGRSGQNPEESRERIHRLMADMPTGLNAEVRGTSISVGQLLDMQRGDVVRLDQRVDGPVDLSVNGSPKFKGQVVLSNGHRAIQTA
ncbi:MAG TPA: FliM/FliN family flagellar motor switch protein [Acidobacteriota bacterium]|nr:FliM/FliN family flagellar motor switch protein [Acidobacteriota bacterium]